MKIYKSRLKFHWSLSLWVQLTKFQHWFRKCLGAGQATSHYLNQLCLVYWRIYASLGLDDLTQFMNEYMCKQVNKSICRSTPDILRLTYISMIVADALASNRPQTFSNHHTGSTGTSLSWNLLRNAQIMIQTSKQLSLWEIRRQGSMFWGVS